MSSAVIPAVIAAFLSGALTVAFTLLVIGIRAGDRPGHLTARPPRGRLESHTRTILGVGVRTSAHREN